MQFLKSVIKENKILMQCWVSILLHRNITSTVYKRQNLTFKHICKRNILKTNTKRSEYKKNSCYPFYSLFSDFSSITVTL